MILVVGLGNPGKEYEKTRHNAGFLCLDVLRENLKFPPWEDNKKFNAETSEGEFGGEKLLLAKPQTFMNASGTSVSALSQFYKIHPKNLWLVYDDIDLPLGTLRIRAEGSAGTHNGMKSVIEHLGNQNFPRLRIGIESRGTISPEQQDISSFVLTPFHKEEMPPLKKSLEKGSQLILEYLQKPLPAATTFTI